MILCYASITQNHNSALCGIAHNRGSALHDWEKAAVDPNLKKNHQCFTSGSDPEPSKPYGFVVLASVTTKMIWLHNTDFKVQNINPNPTKRPDPVRIRIHDIDSITC
jgi:hypothetical protein